MNYKSTKTYNGRLIDFFIDDKKATYKFRLNGKDYSTVIKLQGSPNPEATFEIALLLFETASKSFNIIEGVK